MVLDKGSILQFLYSKRMSPLEFNWETMVAPPLLSLLNINDVIMLNKIAMSNKLASKPKEKYQMIKSILEPRGFKQLASGTNRVVYKFLEDQRYCLKVALDRVGLKDNPAEFNNQFKLKPFVAKTFETTPCGTVALVERVKPITSKEEYRYIAGDIFDLLIEKIIGKYVVDDIGTRFFQNIGIRVGWGPVLLDYPYVYELDGRKIMCNWQNPYTKEYCLGEIDYDAGCNFLVCTKCGKQYQARQLAKQVENKSLIVETRGVRQDMKFTIYEGNEPIKVIETNADTDTIVPESKARTLKIRIRNKKFLDEAIKRETKSISKRPEQIRKGIEKRHTEIKNNIIKACDNLYSEGEELVDKDTPEVEVVEASEISKKNNPNYMESGRFPRVKQTSPEASPGQITTTEYTEEDEYSKSVEVEDGEAIAKHIDMVNEAKRLARELAEQDMKDFHKDDKDACDKPSEAPVDMEEALEATVPPKTNKAADEYDNSSCNQNTSVKNYAYPDNPIKNKELEESDKPSPDDKIYKGGYATPDIVDTINITLEDNEVMQNY